MQGTDLKEGCINHAILDLYIFVVKQFQTFPVESARFCFYGHVFVPGSDDLLIKRSTNTKSDANSEHKTETDDVVASTLLECP